MCHAQCDHMLLVRDIVYIMIVSQCTYRKLWLLSAYSLLSTMSCSLPGLNPWAKEAWQCIELELAYGKQGCIWGGGWEGAFAPPPLRPLKLCIL